MADEMKMLGVRMTAAQIDIVKRDAAEVGKSLQDYVTETLMAKRQLAEWMAATERSLAKNGDYFRQMEAESGPDRTPEERATIVKSLMRPGSEA